MRHQKCILVIIQCCYQLPFVNYFFWLLRFFFWILYVTLVVLRGQYPQHTSWKTCGASHCAGQSLESLLFSRNLLASRNYYWLHFNLSKSTNVLFFFCTMIVLRFGLNLGSHVYFSKLPHACYCWLYFNLSKSTNAFFYFLYNDRIEV